MARMLHRALSPLAALPRRVSAAFWLQSGACAVVAWCLLHGGTAVAPAARAPADNAIAGSTPAAATSGTPGATPSAPGTPASAAGAPPPSPPMPLTAVPGPVAAQLALSTIDVIVTRNDTLDRIFRRLKLNLADLASLRGLSLPGLR